MSPGWRPFFPEVFFAPVAQPYSQHLWNLLLLLFVELGVELEGALPLESACRIVVRVPVAPGDAYSTTDFLDKLFAGELLCALSHGIWR